MKSLLKLITAAAVSALCLVSCAETSPVVLVKIDNEYTLSQSDITFKAGENATIGIEKTTETEREITVEWKSSDESVLTVENGEITAISAGEAEIYAVISSEGCESFTLCCDAEIKPGNYMLADFSQFIFITDISTKEHDYTTMFSYLSKMRENIKNMSVSKGSIKLRNSENEEQAFEINIGETSRAGSKGINDGLGENGYRIRTEVSENGMKIFVGGVSAYQYVRAMDYILSSCVKTKECVFVPSDLDCEGEASPDVYTDIIMESDTAFVRDPCVIIVESKYYMYGSGLGDAFGSYGCVSGDDLLNWSDPVSINNFAEISDYNGDPWAPECHIYNGAYYIFGTYKSSVTGHRGCAIYRSENPEGPFEMITGGHFTPADWDAIDATLYIDENGDPWSVYVREWVSAPNNVGTFVAVRLSDDLTEAVSEPVELFKSSDPAWATNTVTDGCFLYKMESTGSLIMLWSNFDQGGYCLAMARSKSGSILGPWEQIPTRLYSALYSGGYDGGHGMIFKDKDGQLTVAFHEPNSSDTVRAHAFFMPVEEDAANDMLVPKTETAE